MSQQKLYHVHGLEDLLLPDNIVQNGSETQRNLIHIQDNLVNDAQPFIEQVLEWSWYESWHDDPEIYLETQGT